MNRSSASPLAIPADQILAAAIAAHGRGQLLEAERLARQVLAKHPENVQANLLLGVLAGKTARNDLAFKQFEQVLAADPKSFEALFWLSMLYRREGDLEKATYQAQKALAVRPGDPHGLNNLGLCLLDDLRLEEAVAAFRKAASHRPDMPSIYHNLGTSLHLLGRDVDAVKAFERALVLSPGSLESILSLGQVLLSQGNIEGAEKLARRALAMNPNSSAPHLLLASALTEDNRAAEAEGHLSRAVSLDPRDAKAHALLGMRFQSLGRFDEGNKQIEKSIELEPRQGFAYFAYVFNNKLTEQDRQLVKRMESLVVEGRVAPRELSFLHYGLGRALESLGEYEQALKHFDEANQLARLLKFGVQEFDRKAYAAGIDRLIDHFPKELVQAPLPEADSSDLPILIVGMMRSGTTLAEQILSSHPHIGAAGEQRFWLHARQAAGSNQGVGFAPATLPALGQKYVRQLAEMFPGLPRVTDKMPANYELLGPIHMALPNARLIHMKRNSLDTCVSIYTTPNGAPIPFAHDRSNIVFAYKQYVRLMAHWKEVLPENRLLEVRYEDLITDRESVARRMLEFMGLDWNEALLHHEQNTRSVVTPSLWQVRQPIYDTSVERWRRYEPWLGEFSSLLSDT